MCDQDRQRIIDAYAAFNARDVDRALSTMTADVDWPNGTDGGYVHRHAEVRADWTRQWTQIDPHVEPVGFTDGADGRIAHMEIRA